jgi:hypothetical protein
MSSPLVERMPADVYDSISKPAPGSAETPSFYDTSKPTCSLNLVCYRSGAKGCDLQQIHCLLRSRLPGDESFVAIADANPHLVHTDDQFFHEIRQLYETKMCGFFRRYFSLKTLRMFRVLAVSYLPEPDSITGEALRADTSHSTRQLHAL